MRQSAAKLLKANKSMEKVQRLDIELSQTIKYQTVPSTCIKNPDNGVLRMDRYKIIPGREYITCQICGKPRRLITERHVKMHGYTMKRYKEEFPDAPLICQDSKAEISKTKLNQKAFTENKKILEKEKETSLDYVQCEICGKRLKEIGNTHLAKHGMTISQYEKKFPNSERRGKSTAAERERIAKIAVPRMWENQKKIYPGKYGSELFRSKLEVQIADLLHELNLPVMYENFTILMNDSHYYWPDFYIPKANLIIEAKGLFFYTDYCNYKREQSIDRGYNYEFIFDNQNPKERLLEIIEKYKLMI